LTATDLFSLQSFIKSASQFCITNVCSWVA